MRREDEMFWARLADMPWVEAEHECVQRREELLLQMAMLDGEGAKAKEPARKEIFAEVKYIHGQLGVLNERIKYLRKAQEQVNLHRAAKAILDPDVWEQIVIHKQTLENQYRKSNKAPQP